MEHITDEQGEHVIEGNHLTRNASVGLHTVNTTHLFVRGNVFAHNTARRASSWLNILREPHRLSPRELLVVSIVCAVTGIVALWWVF